jgi:hypothetical protein
MGLDISGSTILAAGSGLTINSGFSINASGYAAPTNLPGYSGYRSGGSLYYSTGSGWIINGTSWNSIALNTSTGVFTCPVAGFYAVGFNGIAIGYGTEGSYGYAGFGKNGALSYYIHWNLADGNAWQQSGGSSVFNCAVNDTLSFYINQSPSPVATAAITNNRGWYPDNHHAVWCILIG